MDLYSDVERLLVELCIDLGFCLPPDEIRRLCESPPKTVDSFTDAVFVAEGLGEVIDTGLRRQVREVVARHMSGWPDEPPVRWIVWRQDDNGNRFEVVRKDSRAEADEVAAAMEARGHKQMYWVAKTGAPSS